MVAKCKSSSKDQQSNSNPFNIGMIFAISSIWKLFFMHLGSVELMGLQMNIFYLKTIWWNSLGSLMKYYLLFEKCFSVLLEYLLSKKAFQIIFYLKNGLNHHPPKKTMFLNSFSPTPPRRRECKSTSGRVPLREVLLHSPLRGVTRVRASMFYWFYLISLQKSQIKWQLDRRFSNRRYCKDHPNVEGCKGQQ